MKWFFLLICGAVGLGMLGASIVHFSAPAHPRISPRFTLGENPPRVANSTYQAESEAPSASTNPAVLASVGSAFLSFSLIGFYYFRRREEAFTESGFYKAVSLRGNPRSKTGRFQAARLRLVRVDHLRDEEFQLTFESLSSESPKREYVFPSLKMRGFGTPEDIQLWVGRETSLLFNPRKPKDYDIDIIGLARARSAYAEEDWQKKAE